MLSLLAVGLMCAVAHADNIPVGDLSYDAISSTTSQFDITNLTGAGALPPDAPITTLLNFAGLSLVVNFTSGPSLTLPGSDFTVEPDGEVDCDAPACNLFGDNITSATLTGTLSPTSGLSGLPGSDTGILSAFTTTITPDSVNCTGGTLEAGCDTAIIYATGTTGVVPTPEPETWGLIGIGLVGLLVARRSLLGTRAV
jgi:hypothetical protein